MKQKINLRLIEITILAIVTTTICITFVYYSFFENQVKRDLKTSGKILRETSYFETKDVDADDIELAHDFHELRITWIDSDGKVLYDNDVESEELSNHGDRPEIKSAIKNGSGESVRKSDTMNMNTYYYAKKLDNGTILRVSVEAVNLSSVFVKVMPAVSGAAAAMLRTTVAFTMASGSEGTNVLPQEAWVIANMRYSHHQGGKASIEAISRFAKKFDIETVVLDGGVDSPVSDHRSDAYKLVDKAVSDVFPGVKTTPYIMTAASDSRFMWRVSENCLRFAPFSIDDFQLDGIHGINENVSLSALAPAVDFYRYIIKNA